MHSFKLLRSLLPPIKVHCWGGLGSQLYSFLVLERLQRRFPYRDVMLVAHTSGVTERLLELPESLLSQTRYSQVFDFSTNPNSSNFSSQRKFKTAVARFLKSIEIISEVSTWSENKCPKPWIMSTRGHYTNIKFSQEEILNLARRILLHDASPKIAVSQVIAVHYRLGDLVNLTSKDFVNPEILATQIKTLNVMLPVIVYSDSNEAEVYETLKGLIKISHVSNISTLSTIADCVKAKYFIGSTSKISIWIALFRTILYDLPSVLPETIFQSLKSSLAEESISKKIDWYSID